MSDAWVQDVTENEENCKYDEIKGHVNSHHGQHYEHRDKEHRDVYGSEMEQQMVVTEFLGP